jgi:2-dehydropantoate 2-reductase
MENKEGKKKSVVIVGSGAVGLSYGSRLLEAEQGGTTELLDVHFILRRDFEHIQTHGIRMKSPDGDYFSGNGRNLQRKLHKDSSTIVIPASGIDWLICAVKSYSIEGSEGEFLKKLILPMVGINTRIILIMNGLGSQKYLCEWFKDNSIFVGMAFTCVNRNDPSSCSQVTNKFILVNHIAFGALHIGHCKDDEAELEIVKKLWAGTKIANKVTLALTLI